MTTDGTNLKPLMSVRQLSELLQVSVGTIYDWRMSGQGPRCIKVGGHLRFDPDDVRAWLNERRAESSQVQDMKRSWVEQTDGMQARLKRHRHNGRW